MPDELAAALQKQKAVIRPDDRERLIASFLADYPEELQFAQVRPMGLVGRTMNRLRATPLGKLPFVGGPRAGETSMSAREIRFDPTLNLTPSELEKTLKHELTHVRQRLREPSAQSHRRALAREAVGKIRGQQFPESEQEAHGVEFLPRRVRGQDIRLP